MNLSPREELHPEWQAWLERFVTRRGFHFRQLERGELWRHKDFPFASLDELVLYFVLHDPVYFVESCFTERDSDDQHAWRLWDYQKVSMRYRGHVVHEDGAEVGKSREIVGLVVWNLIAHRGDQLVGGALDGHVDALWKDIDWQLEANPWLDSQIDRDATKQKPYVELVARNGNRVFFRPAGVTGKAFRSVHARRAIYMDEAAKVQSKEAWGNFFSRAKPGAEIRVYSVPDGNRTTKFFELAQKAPAVLPDGSNLDKVSTAAADFDIEGLKGRRFVRFRWPKTLMPAPFYTPARASEWEEQYGGRDSPEYQHNVLGNWGDPEASIFPWSQFSPCLRYLPDYACVRLLWDDSAGAAVVSAHRLRPGYRITGPAGDEDLGADESDSATISLAHHRPAAPDDFATVDAIESVLREFLSPVPGALVAGIDPGTSDDPCEILIYLALDPVLRCVARVELRQFVDPRKRQVLYALQRIFQPSQGWGLDATGAGAPLQHELIAGTEDPAMAFEFELGLSGFVFNAGTVDVHPETGEAAVDPNTGKERRVSYLEQGVTLVRSAIQRRNLELPYDPDFSLQFPGYTERIGGTGKPSYGHNKHDHLVAATIAARLRHFHLRMGTLTTPPVTFASVPRGGAGGRSDSRLGHRRPGLAATSGGLATALSSYTGSGSATSRSRTSRASSAARALGDW